MILILQSSSSSVNEQFNGIQSLGMSSPVVKLMKCFSPLKVVHVQIKVDRGEKLMGKTYMVCFYHRSIKMYKTFLCYESTNFNDIFNLSSCTSLAFYYLNDIKTKEVWFFVQSLINKNKCSLFSLTYYKCVWWISDDGILSSSWAHLLRIDIHINLNRL